jgi:tetratricopeptide (TPR) repeat protein
VKVTDDEALKSLRSGLAFAEIGFLDKGREGILKALELDPAVFERAPAPEECWLLCAKAFAESDPERAIAAYRRATSINPGVAHRVNPTWRLADLLKEHGVR